MASLPLIDSRTFLSRTKTRKGTAVTSYSSDISGSSSALMLTKDIVGGDVTGYPAARVLRIVGI